MRALRHSLSEFLRSLWDLPTPSTVRMLWQLLTTGAPQIEPVPEINSATQFPGLLSVVRLIITIGIGLRFTFHKGEYYINGWRLFLQVLLFALFALYAVIFELAPSVRRAVTTRPVWRRTQVVLEIATLSVFYFLTDRVDSDFFLFFILPILFAAEYAGFRESFLVTATTCTAFLATISILSVFKLDLNPYFQSWLEVFLRVFLPRSFALSVVGVVCAFYRRVEGDYAAALLEEARLEAARASIRQRISTQVRATEFSDQVVVHEVLRIVLAGVTAEDGVGFERAMLFLEQHRGGPFRGVCGMGPVNKAQGKRMWRRPVQWYFDNLIDLERREVRFRSRKLNRQLDKTVLQQEIVQSLADELLDIGTCAVASGQWPHLANALTEFDADEFAMAPFHVGGRLVGLLIADNITTGKRIGVRERQELALFANLAAHVVESAALLHEHVEEKRREAVLDSAIGLAHEIRNPLEAIRVRAESLCKQGHGDEDIRQMATWLLSDTKRLKNIIDRYVRFGTLTKGLKLSEECMVDLVEEILEDPSIKQQLCSNGIELVTFLPEAKSETIASIDAGLVREAITNVLRNAIDAVLEGGQRRIEVRLRQNRKCVEVEIRDYGSGISDRDFDEPRQVFEPFETTKELSESSGVGLGLPIALAAVRAHQGDIQLSSSSEGVRVTIVIPK